MQTGRLALEQFPSPRLHFGGNKDIVHCSFGASAALLAAPHIVGLFPFPSAEGVALGTGASTVLASSSPCSQPWWAYRVLGLAA